MRPSIDSKLLQCMTCEVCEIYWLSKKKNMHKCHNRKNRQNPYEKKRNIHRAMIVLIVSSSRLKYALLKFDISFPQNWHLSDCYVSELFFCCCFHIKRGNIICTRYVSNAKKKKKTSNKHLIRHIDAVLSHFCP